MTKENIDPKKRPDKDKYVQFGGASVEPKTGAIRAIYGGKDALEHYTNNADYTGIQVGSTFKPFVLAAAMDPGKLDPDLPRDQPDSARKSVSPKSVYNGDNKVKLRDYNGEIWHDRDGKEWHQRNDDNQNKGRISLRDAMRFSVNTPYIQLGMDVGLEQVRDAALKAGLTEDQLTSLTPTFSLGTSAPSAIRMAGRTRRSPPAASRPTRTRSTRSRRTARRCTTTTRRPRSSRRSARRWRTTSPTC
ncbi:penicillin-binding transpeptidase domain-containing protein [Streptomyces sp. M19]